MMTAILLSGGTGTRLGSNIPKQYIEVQGRPVISYCIRTLSCCEEIDRIVIVAASSWQEYLRQCLQEEDVQEKFLGFAEPGENRQMSVYHALEYMRDNWDCSGAMNDDDCVLIHDAARPLLTVENISCYIDALQEHDGVLPVLPMKDTVYLSQDGSCVSALLDRKEIFAGQAPEIFRYLKYMHANESLLQWMTSETGQRVISPTSKIFSINGSTEPAILAGMDVVMVPGNEGNFKITTLTDLKRFQSIVKNRRSR